MKDILLISNYWHFQDEKSSSRYLHIANMLVLNNYNVEVVTSTFYHRDKMQRSTSNKKYKDYLYKITLIYEKGYKKNVSIARLISHKQFAFNVSKYLKKRKKPDIIYCFVPPLELADRVTKYAKRNKIKLIIDVLDLWPEAFKMVINAPILTNLIFKPFENKANRIYKRADEIIAVSYTNVERAAKLNNKIGHKLYIGIDLIYFDKIANKYRSQIDDKDKIWIAYIGTLGTSYDIKLIIDALNQLLQKGIDNFKFIVMGDGPLREEFKSYAKTNKIDIDFKGMLSYEEMIKILVNCDIAVNPIKQGTAASIINKHADYAAARLPVINTQESSEYIDLLKRYNAGLSSKPNELDLLVSNIERLIRDDRLRYEIGNNSRKLAEAEFDRNLTYEIITKVIEGE